MTIKEVIKVVMAMEDDTYYAIVEALEVEDTEGYPMYSVSEIAEQFGVALEVVEYIDRAEHDEV